MHEYLLGPPHTCSGFVACGTRGSLILLPAIRNHFSCFITSFSLDIRICAQSLYLFMECSGDITGRPVDREGKERSSISRVKDCCRGMGIVWGQAGIKVHCIVEELKMRKEKEEK